MAVPLTVYADTAPPDPTSPTSPVTVSADPLPTVQIDGVAWTQLVVGNTVYIGGSFGTARPAGAAPGTNTTPRANLLAFDLTTGALIGTFVANTNGDVFALAASPDRSTIYAGGSFTTVNGVSRQRLVAMNATTGAVLPHFQTSADASVHAIVLSGPTVYFGGNFSKVNGVSRSRLAAARALDGALLSWTPRADGGGDVGAQVSALAMAPTGDRILVGGRFTTLNESSNPGYGLGAVDLAGNSLPWAANGQLRNAGDNAGITAAVNDTRDPRFVYVTGYVYGKGGNMEGIAKLNWETGGIEWLADCHGDSYGAYPMAGSDAVYVASHAHYCGNLPDGPPQTSPWSDYRATAFSSSRTQTLTRDQVGYPDFMGLPAPSVLRWLPQLESGTYTGQSQAAWSVTGNDKFVVYGGEFPTANGMGQQGLVRYAVPSLAPNKMGPEVSGPAANPALTSVRTGEIRLTWQANWDRDNEQLTYRIVRDGDTTAPVHTATELSAEWDRPSMGFVDSGLVPGRTYRYQIVVTDPFGNEARSDTVSLAAAAVDAVSPYAASVLADGAAHYWPLNEPSGSTMVDLGPAFTNAHAELAVTRGSTGAFPGSGSATTFRGNVFSWASTRAFLKAAPRTFTTELWVRTTSTEGGKIVSFGSSNTGSSYSHDRHTYFTEKGEIVFGVLGEDLTKRTVTSSKAYNNGQWHHVVSSLGADGMRLFVDGVEVARRTDVTSAYSYRGFWRIGGDTLLNWPERGNSDYLAGDIDEVAVYPLALSATQVAEHYETARNASTNGSPTALFTHSADRLAVTFDGTASTDPDGSVATYAWDFGDGKQASGALTTHKYAQPGSYRVTLTVTDGAGATATLTQDVIVVSNLAPTAAFLTAVSQLSVAVDASAAADADGSIEKYVWDFGDGTAGKGKLATHTYATPGEYTVRLSVTDDTGAIGTASQTVTVPAGSGSVPETGPDPGGHPGKGKGSDKGQGNAYGHLKNPANGYPGVGLKNGVWSRYGGSAFSLMTAGRMTISPTCRSDSLLTALSSGSSDVSLTVSDLSSAHGSKKPGYTVVSIAPRTVGSDEYRTTVRISEAGAGVLVIARLVDGKETILRSVVLGSISRYTAGKPLQIRTQVFGTNGTAIRAKVWVAGTAEPSAWTAAAVDTAAVLQQAGGVCVVGYVPAGSGIAPLEVTVEDLEIHAGP